MEIIARTKINKNVLVIMASQRSVSGNMEDYQFVATCIFSYLLLIYFAGTNKRASSIKEQSYV